MDVICFFIIYTVSNLRSMRLFEINDCLYAPKYFTIKIFLFIAELLSVNNEKSLIDCKLYNVYITIK